MLVPALVEGEHDIGQHPSRPDAPRPATARQSVHWHVSGRARALPRLDAVVLLFPSPCACTLHPMPGPRQAPPLAVACAVDEDIITTLPPWYCKYATIASTPQTIIRRAIMRVSSA
jgi:hypothetical protein